VTLLVAILLAVFVLSPPWGAVAVALALVVELGEVVLFFRWSRLRRAAVGAEALVGEEGVALAPLDPEGQVRVFGEIWQARSSVPVAAGDCVRVAAVERLTLVVDPCD
jgi:membrane protein implicated in regulation of membrane protease activity